MSSIDSSSRKAQQAELNDLQAEYARKKKDLRRENDEDLADLKDYYSDKKESLTKESEAAISHIRRRPVEIAEEAAEERRRLTENYNNRNNKLQKTYDEKISSTRELHQKKIAEAQDSAQKKVKEIEGYSQNRLEEIRKKSSEEVGHAKEKFNKDLAETNANTEKKLTSQREQNKAVIQNEVERGKTSSEKLRTRNEKSYNELRERGEQQISQEKTSQEKKLERVEDEAARRYDLQQKQWSAKEERLNSDYTRRIQHGKEAHEQALKNQNEHFQSTYMKNEDAQRESLSIQKKRYVRELAETKKDFVKSGEKYANKEEDPFYKVENRGSYLRENPDFYILRAYVPEHEKDSIKVNIQNDRATVSGQRSFKDKLEDEGKIVSTSSFQSFREEFPFEKPVITEGMTRERQGDWVVYQIPKGLNTRFSRKA